MQTPTTITSLLPLGVAYLNPNYPFHIPYRLNQLDTHTQPSGRTPRILTIFLTTLIHTGDPAYDPTTRIIRLHRGFRILSRQAGMFTSVPSRRILADTIRHYTTPQPSSAGMVTPVLEWHDAPLLADMWLRLSPEYVKLISTDVHETPLEAITRTHGRPFELDMLALASLYAPETRQLLIELTVLKSITPVSIPSRTKFQATLNHLNRIQEQWEYRLLANRVSVRPVGLLTTVGDADSLSMVDGRVKLNQYE